MSLRRRQPRARRPLRCCTSFSKNTSIARAWTVRDGARTAADARAATSYDRRGAPYKNSTQPSRKAPRLCDYIETTDTETVLRSSRTALGTKPLISVRTGNAASTCRMPRLDRAARLFE